MDGGKIYPTNLMIKLKSMDDIMPEKYIGLTLKEAIEQAGKEGLQSRVKVFNNIPQRVTADHKPDRLNFHVENNIVEDVTLG